MEKYEEDFKKFMKGAINIYKKCDIYIDTHLRNEGFTKFEEIVFWAGFTEIKRDQFARYAEKEMTDEHRKKLSNFLIDFKEQLRIILKD